ncbi:MAG: hypothetical protein ACRD1E_11585 [Terriglobales bacterium]
MTLRFSKPHAIGLAVTVAVVAAVWLALRIPDQPPGQRDDIYARQVAILAPSVSAAQSMMAGGVVYFNGTLDNRGSRALTGFIVELTFTDMDGKPIERARRVLLDGRQRPVPAHGTRNFEIGFDKVPAGWNQAPPTPRPVAVYVK